MQVTDTSEVSTSLFTPDAHVPQLQTLADKGVYIGTSSWKYEGWVGQIYNGDYSSARSTFNKKRFDEGSLREFAHVFRSVCFDGAYYRLPDEDSLKKMADSVPDNFQMSFKCTESITVRRYPEYGGNPSTRGKMNPGYLDWEAFTRYFHDPLMRVFEGKIGSIIFEFSPFFFSKPMGVKDGYSKEQFVSELDRFLSKLPRGVRYSVEVRDSDFIQGSYFDYTNMLRRHNVPHVLNAQTWMPPVEEQMKRTGILTGDFMIVRGLTRPGLTHQKAVEKYEPYDKTQEPNAGFRSAMVELVLRALEEKIQLYIYINNRLEGNAPNTIATILDMLSTVGKV